MAEENGSNYSHESNQNVLENNNIPQRKDKIIIQNQMIINAQQNRQQQQQQLQQQQQHIQQQAPPIASKRMSKKTIQAPIIYAAAAAPNAAHTELQHFITTSPATTATFQTQIAGINISGTNTTSASSNISINNNNNNNATTAIPIVTYNGNQYCVTNVAAATTDKEGKTTTNFILMSPVQVQQHATIVENLH